MFGIVGRSGSGAKIDHAACLRDQPRLQRLLKLDGVDLKESNFATFRQGSAWSSRTNFLFRGFDPRQLSPGPRLDAVRRMRAEHLAGDEE